MRDPNTLTLELKLVDGYGRVHGVVCRELPKEAAFMGSRIKKDLELGIVAIDRMMSPFEATVEVLKVKELRRSLLKDAATNAGGQLADFLQDREGWHGLDRQEQTEKIVGEKS